MNISWPKKCRFLTNMLMVLLLPTISLATCDFEPVLSFKLSDMMTRARKVITTCGQDEKVTFPMEQPKNFPPCNQCEQILRIIQIKGNILPSASFVSYNTTNHLYLENLGLEKISPGAFESLDLLEELHLKGNKLKEIPVGVLNIPKLITIDLSQNSLESTKQISLVGNTHVKSVNLSHNILTGFEFNANWSNVSTLDLSNNEISNIDPKLLPVNLTVLNVSSNCISSIDGYKNLSVLDLGSNFFKVFTFSNSTVKNLILRNNFITDIYGSYCHISYIDLSNNKLNSVPCDCTGKPSQVQKLNLANNVISEVKPQTIAELHMLEELHLESNKIKTISPGTFVSLHHLMYLNLSHNQIEEFSFGSIDNIKYLNDFDVSHNKLKTITKYIMHTFINLHYLHLEYNNISFINGTILNMYLPTIWEINIVGNNLTCNNIWDILKTFNKRYTVHFPHGPFRNVTNVHGMPCSFIGNTKDEDFLTSADEVEINKAVEHYFNSDYRDSNFYKFLEESQKLKFLIYNATRKMKEASQQNVASTNSEIGRYLILIIMFLISIACLYAWQAYILYKKFRPRAYEEEQLM